MAVTETTYHEDKMYVPREVREKLGLANGDVLRIEVVEKGVAKLSVVRRREATKTLEKLINPSNFGAVKRKLSREEIY
ncbi:MAG: hypothetical protein QXX34_00520 [Candidatus Bathyarchaeia archaeon]